jgi:hypothetical protein
LNFNINSIGPIFSSKYWASSKLFGNPEINMVLLFLHSNDLVIIKFTNKSFGHDSPLSEYSLRLLPKFVSSSISFLIEDCIHILLYLNSFETFSI